MNIPGRHGKNPLSFAVQVLNHAAKWPLLVALVLMTGLGPAPGQAPGFIDPFGSSGKTTLLEWLENTGLLQLLLTGDEQKMFPLSQREHKHVSPQRV